LKELPLLGKESNDSINDNAPAALASGAQIIPANNTNMLIPSNESFSNLVFFGINAPCLNLPFLVKSPDEFNIKLSVQFQLFTVPNPPMLWYLPSSIRSPNFCFRSATYCIDFKLGSFWIRC